MFISEVYNVTWTVPEEEANEFVNRRRQRKQEFAHHSKEQGLRGEPHVEQKFHRRGWQTQRGAGGQGGTIDRGFEDIGATGGASEGEKQVKASESQSAGGGLGGAPQDSQEKFEDQRKKHHEQSDQDKQAFSGG